MIQSALTIVDRRRDHDLPRAGLALTVLCRCRSSSTRRPLQQAARPAVTRRCSNDWPSCPRTSRRTSPASAWSRPSPARTTGWTASPRPHARVRPEALLDQASAFFDPLIGFIPSLGLAAVLIYGGNLVIDGKVARGFTAFYFYVGMLIGPMRMLGGSARVGAARDCGRRAGSSSCSTAGRRSRPLRTPAAAGRRRRVELRGRDLRYPGAGADTDRGSTSSRPGRDGRDRRWHRLGQDDAGRLDLAPVRRDRGRVLVDGADVRTVDADRCAARSPSSPRTASSSRATIADNIAYARDDVTESRSSRPRERAQIEIHHTCRTATTP